ncbi:trypsin-like peptidase domain-containing protein [Streptacidiphilus jiangxiensis]|uniref:Trypsin-like peptidase domain-containing protein n=1 Tax=Streptacidiphilus jiangxiensis TaxID=235985 RepID=A0A1H7G942_STRJI|nr:trypsin-like peptidase domain-containing protein [Streptacidiphilus jiangxiensis]SEK32295.1 Trypsin-like peptidase domain-containing protein [Streptacidiphilus jiangxiensis]
MSQGQAGEQEPLGREELLAVREAIVRLAKAATVRIQHPDLAWPDTPENRRFVWGSGFFVAPGWVLTDAHVLWPRGEGTEPWRGDGEVGLALADNRLLRGRWAAALPGRRVAPDHPDGLYPWPDLALVRVTGEAPDHPCVWLDEFPPPPGTEVTLCGRSSYYDGYYAEWDHLAGIGGHDGAFPRPRLQLTGADLPHGSSGGPVVDRYRGSVCAAVTARAGEYRPGGVASPMHGLRELASALGPLRPGLADVARYQLDEGLGLEPDELFRRIWSEHDRYHARHTAWVDLVARLRRGIPGPDPRWLTRLRAGLARLPAPPPGVPLGLVERLRPGQLPTPLFAPRLWRDGLDLLVGLWGADTVELAERYCRLAADWEEERAPRGRVVVQVDTSVLDDDAYLCTVDRFQGGEHAMRYAASNSAVPESGLLELLGDPLGRALLDAEQGGAPAEVELRLPRRLFELPVHELRTGGGAGAPIGERHPVTVRDVDGGAEVTVRALHRWQALEAGPLQPLLVPLGRDVGRAAVRAAVRAGDRTVPLWRGSVRSGAGATVLDEAWTAGHRVLLWTRGTGPEEEFGSALSARLKAVTLDQIPQLARDLRADASGGESVWARALVVLYDRPEETADEQAPLLPALA